MGESSSARKCSTQRFVMGWSSVEYARVAPRRREAEGAMEGVDGAVGAARFIAFVRKRGL